MCDVNIPLPSPLQRAAEEVQHMPGWISSIQVHPWLNLVLPKKTLGVEKKECEIKEGVWKKKLSYQSPSTYNADIIICMSLKPSLEPLRFPTVTGEADHNTYKNVPFF